MSEKMILVTGATGQQGGAVARHLLQQPGFSVRAMTREAEKPSSWALAQKGAKLVEGDLDDPASLRRAMEGAWGVFSVQTFAEAGCEGEVRQGKAVVDAAKAAGVKHLVYSSVVSADRDTGLPQFESKRQVEQYLAQSGLSYTILRPAFFMQNWYSYLRDPILSGTLPLPLRPQTPLQEVSTEDIGSFAVMAFQNPDKWRGKTVELAGDDLSMQRVAEQLSRATGREVKYVQVPWDQFEKNAGEEIAKMYRWFEDVGYHVDIASLRKEFPKLSTLENALRQQDWASASGSARKAA